MYHASNVIYHTYFAKKILKFISDLKFIMHTATTKTSTEVKEKIHKFILISVSQSVGCDTFVGQRTFS